MPVELLFVEGALDREVLFAVLQNRLTLEFGWSKNELAGLCRRERRRLQNANIAYLRDRDFDFDPTDDTSQPTIDRQDNDGSVLGWRWACHEIENYLIDPGIVVAAMGWDRGQYEQALLAAGQRIRHYQVARWVVGAARRSLPPHHQLRTRPDTIPHDTLRLPDKVSKMSVIAWARGHVAKFRRGVSQTLSKAAIRASIEHWTDKLSDPRFNSVDEILVWCSGKDLLAALEPWLIEMQQPNAGHFRAMLRDWIRDHPDESLAILPEWQSLLRILTS